MMDSYMSHCYGSISMFSAILHNVFLLYHVETFVAVYKIDKTSFWVGETIFLIWNSCNDPLFGWLSDKVNLTNQERAGQEHVVMKRIRALQFYGPLFAVSFLAFWKLWTIPSLQFVICLCVYDGFLTMIDLHHCALLADLAVSSEARTRLNFFSSLFSALGALTVFVSYMLWDRKNWAMFQMFCIVISVISILGFMYSTYKLKQACSNLHRTISVNSRGSESRQHRADVNFIEERAALTKFVKDLAGHKNFIWFAVMNLVQVFHCHFNSNFFPLFLENLLGDSVPQILCSLILGISFMAPHLNNLYFLSLCRRYGVYSVVRALFILKLVLSVVMFICGPSHMWLLVLFIASNRVFTEGTCKLLTLVISDLVDEDFVIHRRKEAVSALMFGTAAFLSKPGQTLAPLVGTWLLSIHTGHDVFETGNTGGSVKLDLLSMETGQQDDYRTGVFQLLVYIPMLCAIIQLLAWSRFTLKGHKLQTVKNLRKGAAYLSV